jgi:pyruvate ferredoxin oxidoreductase gamma subunit
MTENKEKIFSIVLNGRGGQGAITAGLVLCEMAYKDGYTDVLSIPKIGAERRGAPIKAFVKLSKKRKIKNYASPEDADFTIIFDPSLTNLPGVGDAVKHGTVLINTKNEVDTSIFPEKCKIYTVPVTEISLDMNLLASGYAILNIPLLGAFTQLKYRDEDGNEMSLGLNLETIREVAIERFGSRGEKNYEAAVKAANQVKEIQ